MYLVKPVRVQIAYVNLKRAFGARYTPTERLRIVREAFRTLGQTGAELLRLPRIDRRYVDRYITVHGMEHLEAALARKHGIIFLTGHFGNWELSSIVGALKGYPMVALAREQKFPRLYRLLNSLREAKGCRVVGKGMALRAMVQELRANRIVGIAGDQGAKTQGVRVQLFGRDALTPAGPVELALRTDATVLPTFIRRTRGPQHVIEIEPPLDVTPRPGETPETAVHRSLQTFMERLEAHIRQAPGQWLWMHRRWKSTQRRHALVLSDGKAGHLNQSLAVVTALRAVRGTGVTHDVIDITYRSSLHRVIAALATWLPVVSPRWMLRWSLTTRQALLDTPCDYVVSCGTATAPANLWLARENAAKSVVIMRPSLVPLRAFTLALIPAHDRPPLRPNIVQTLGAVNTITPERLASAQQEFATRFRLPATSGRRIGVLLGGDTADAQLTPQLVEQVLDELEALCHEWPAQLLVTTSRRTAPEVEQLCLDRLHQRAFCPLLVVANRANPAGTVEGILGASEVIVVSGESSSMVSEAVASGRPVVVIPPESTSSRHPRQKRRAFLEALAATGCVTIAAPDRVGEAVHAAVQRRASGRSSDWELLCHAVRRL